MSGVNASRVILPVVAVDAAVSRTLGIYGSSWLARSGVIVTCAHCIPTLPEGQQLAVTRKNSRGGYDAHLLSRVGSMPLCRSLDPPVSTRPTAAGATHR